MGNEKQALGTRGRRLRAARQILQASCSMDAPWYLTLTALCLSLAPFYQRTAGARGSRGNRMGEPNSLGLPYGTSR